jgi:hypothetical protein
MSLSSEEREAIIRRLMEIDAQLEAVRNSPVEDRVRHSALRCQRVKLVTALWSDNREDE